MRRKRIAGRRGDATTAAAADGPNAAMGYPTGRRVAAGPLGVVGRRRRSAGWQIGRQGRPGQRSRKAIAVNRLPGNLRICG